MFPWYDRHGPVSLRKGTEITGVLPAGRYRLHGHIPPEFEVDVAFEIIEGRETILSLAQGFSFARRFLVDTKAELPVLYLRRRKRHIAHFWIGYCESDERLGALLSEKSRHAMMDEECERGFISEFGQSQNDQWYDHDFMEAGWETKGTSLAERFAEYSWSSEWANELARRAQELALNAPNCFIMLGGSPDRPGDWEVVTPRHIDAPGVTLRYAGRIEFDIW
jgi:hypothetical protein